ncbi:MAG: hypothetical protein PHP45_06860 [Elusimicrobiales bacterium]|nr:hypothetical protein [Elusimicrobiales bacterium]
MGQPALLFPLFCLLAQTVSGAQNAPPPAGNCKTCGRVNPVVEETLSNYFEEHPVRLESDALAPQLSRAEKPPPSKTAAKQKPKDHNHSTKNRKPSDYAVKSTAGANGKVRATAKNPVSK